MRFGLSDELLESIIGFADKNNIEKLYVFGSRARGDYRERSDIDLAALGGNVEGFYLDIEEYTPTLLCFDVVNLNHRITDELKGELERDGVLVHEKA